MRANSQRRGNAEPETPTDAELGACYVFLHLPRFLWVVFLVPGELVPLVQDHFPLRKDALLLMPRLYIKSNDQHTFNLMDKLDKPIFLVPEDLESIHP
jgi:hypothetical protein